jgi:adenylate kinase
MARRLHPNILVSGTPGVGKSTFCNLLAERLGMAYVCVGALVAAKGFHAGKDDAYDTFIVDEASEDRLLDELEPIMARGNVLVEHHSVDLFPERWFDLVLVLRTDNKVLYDRLVQR